jgi:hypothetical protein
MITKQEVIHMAMLHHGSMATNVFDLDYYRNRVKFLDDYVPSKPVFRSKPNVKSSAPALGSKKFKTDKERVAEIQRQKNNYKDTK